MLLDPRVYWVFQTARARRAVAQRRGLVQTALDGVRALDGELTGNIWGSVFRAADVSGTGPRDGAQAVASFAFEDVDLTDPEALQTFRIDTQLTAETYQILGFIDIDGNADPMSPAPDPGDPVTIPIGAYRLDCAVQPVKVEFAILRP